MFYLVRHGKTDYTEKNTGIYQGFGTNLAPLSERGRQEAAEAAEYLKAKKIDLILSSPYTRAVQTAAIISRVTGAEILIETDLHEWLPDVDYICLDDENTRKRHRKYREHGGVYPEGKAKRWESNESMKRRFDAVLRKYQDYENVAVVSHGTILEAASGISLETGGVAEYRL